MNRVEVIQSQIRVAKKPEPFRKWISDTYVSPYDLAQCPLDVVVTYNPSLHANNVAVEDLLSVWPNLPIVQTLQEGRRLCTGVTDHFKIPPGSWGDMQVFARCWSEFVIRHRWLAGKKIGFYPIWSPMAEDGNIARAVIAMGLHWIGAVPEAMDGLGKIEYKRFCQENKLPTADFFELSVKGFDNDHEEASRRMTERYLAQVGGTALEGKAFFVKSDFGGGGRGTKKAEPTRDSVFAAIRKVVAETNKVDGIYAELALDLSGASLYQIELEADAGNLVDGGRFVYFNARNQKMVELGFSSAQVTQYFPAAVYADCLRCTDVIARGSKYDGRGTNEILIVRFPSGEWRIFNSEFNKRIQVEHKALAYLKRYKDGHFFNTVADQLMRSVGYPPPDYTVDLVPSGCQAVGHVRLIAPLISLSGDIAFPSGVTVEGITLPRGFTCTIDIGQLFSDTDAQFGCAIVTGASWGQLLLRLRAFAADTFIFGFNVQRDYMIFLQKFFIDPRVENLSLSCNKTFDVLTNAAPSDSPKIKVAKYLQGSIARILVNSWRPEAGVPNRPYPTAAQVTKYLELRTRLDVTPMATGTPFLAYVDHLDEERYFRDLKAAIGTLGGGMVTVFPRDVQQECGGSESHLVTGTARRLMERVGAACGHFGFEVGGAQFQTAEMNLISSAVVLDKSLCANMGTFSLTRSHWMNALEILAPEEIRYVLMATANQVRQHFALPADSARVPYFPYNFHAGNAVEQDMVTGCMLEVGMSPVPTFCWDPRFTAAQYAAWLQRQLVLWAAHGRTLHHIRIKNAGQQKEWTGENIYRYVAHTRELYKAAYGPAEEPIIHLHNHNFAGNAAHMAVDCLLKCHAVGYQLLLLDTAPPGMTHNNNLVVAKALRLSPAQRLTLNLFNEACHTIWELTERFRDYPLVGTDPHTIWAGGTGSSDQLAARKVGIDRHDVEPAKFLGAQVTGLGAIVTPYSQWSMVVGYNCYNQGLRTFDAVLQHIQSGGTLNLPNNILVGLHEWRTLLPKPEHVTRLIANHMRADHSVFAPAAAGPKTPFSVDAVRRQIAAVAPERRITESDIARFISYRDFALKTIKAEYEIQDCNWLVMLPHIGFAQRVPVGTKFNVEDRPVTLSGWEDIAGTPDVLLTFDFQGHVVRIRQRNAAKAALMHGGGTASSRPMADAANPNHVAAFMPGMIEAMYVKVGQPVKEGDQLYAINSMKMVTIFKAGAQHNGKAVAAIHAKKGDEVAFAPGGAVPLIISLAGK